MWIANTAVKRPVFATMVIGALMIFGLISVGRMPLNLMPEVDFPFVTIRTILPGSDPETVELEISDKIEEAVNTIEGVKSLTSTSLEGLSLVVVEFELEKDVNIAVQDVRDKIAGIRQNLPDQIEEPLVEKLDFNALPVITIAVSGKEVSPEKADEEIRRITEFTRKSIKERLQTVKGVGSVIMIGGQEREIRVWLDADKMRGYNIAIDQVKAVLQAENVEVPGGRIETQRTETVVKTYGNIESIEEFNNLTVAYFQGKPVRLRDIGYAEDGMEDLRSYSFLDGKRAVSLEIRKVSGGNTVEIADGIMAEIERIKQILPQDIRIDVVLDYSVFTRQALSDVNRNMLEGGILAVLTILFFLRSFRTALVAAVALPTSVISTYTFMNALGFSLNQLSMLALTISIGMLIDDAVVVIENIYHKLERGEMDPKKAAIDAIKEIGVAVITTSISLMAVFVPVGLMTGLIGRFFYEFGITVAVAVLISTFISLTLTPMLSSRILRGGVKKHNIIYRGITAAIHALDSVYRASLATALRHRFLTMLAAIAIFFGSMMLAGMIPGEFMPQQDQSRMQVFIEAPLGASIHETRERAAEVEKVVREMPGIEFIYASIGGGSQGKINEASLIVDMVDTAERDFTQAQYIDAMRSHLDGKFPDLRISVTEYQDNSGGAWSSYMVNYSIRGMDMDQLVTFSEQVKERLAKIPGFVDLDTTHDEGKPEIGVRIDREKAADLGVSVANVAFAVNSLIGGEDVTTFRSGGEQYDVRVRYLDLDRDEPQDIEKVLVRSHNGNTVELSNLVTVSSGTGPVQIDRRSRMREVSVVCNLTEAMPLGSAIAAIDQVVGELGIPPGILTEHIGMAEVMQESFESMGFSLMLAIVLIYMALASLFESFIHPFTIMMSLPLSIAGAMGGLLITGKTLSIISMIGVIMLMGLVAKNGILLIDYTIRLRKEGMNRLEALLAAGPRRLRPILMTSISTIAGSIPVAIGMGEGGSFRMSLGVVVIGGMVTSTLLTLLVVPVVYTYMDDLSNLRIPAWLMFWKRKPAREAEATD
jgi:HAE1 family hydrophobic/amphiphilic exporter-1